MKHFIKREKALALRKKEMSYSQIKKILRVSKSSLSLWLRDYPLSKKRIRELGANNESRIEKYRETRKRTKDKRLLKYYNEQKKNVFPLGKRDVFIAGLFLYWGEGTKTSLTHLSLSNTNPSVIIFFIKWIQVVLKIPKHKIRFAMHFYEDMDVKKETAFWAKILNVKESQFSKPYIKKSSFLRINQKGTFGHGTCNARVYNARFSEQILMAIKAISDKQIKLL